MSAPEPTIDQKIARYRGMAESELERANKAGRLDAQTVHTTRATAAATIALSYQISNPRGWSSTA